jgi:hypothetical protein
MGAILVSFGLPIGIGVAFIAIAVFAKGIALIKRTARRNLQRQQQFTVGLTREEFKNKTPLYVEQVVSMGIGRNIPYRLIEWSQQKATTESVLSQSWLLTCLGQSMIALDLEKSCKEGFPIFKHEYDSEEKLIKAARWRVTGYFFIALFACFGAWALFSLAEQNPGKILMSGLLFLAAVVVCYFLLEEGSRFNSAKQLLRAVNSASQSI